MSEDRGASSTLKGRLADVYVPALVDGALQGLSRRLGDRATIDDPLFGRAATMTSIGSLLEKAARRFAESRTTYRHVASVTGIDRDVSEAVLVVETTSGPEEIPIAVVAERRRLREIDLRVYYATGSPHREHRSPLLHTKRDVAIPQIVAHVLDAFRKGAVERVLAAFEESSRFVDAAGRTHTKRDGAMASFVADLGGHVELVVAGSADDGRTCCIEIAMRRQPLKEPELAALSFERGESGLLRELRLYNEP